jgi:hypothetical protein
MKLSVAVVTDDCLTLESDALQDVFGGVVHSVSPKWLTGQLLAFLVLYYPAEPYTKLTNTGFRHLFSKFKPLRINPNALQVSKRLEALRGVNRVSSH